MTDDQLFLWANALPLPAWLALAAAPLARRSAVAAARVLATALCVGYVVMIGAALASASGPAPDLSTLGGLAKAFADPHVMLIGWVHYLAFDLWAGAWEVEDAGIRGVPHAAVIPCLVLTFLAGPAGLLLYLLLRAFFRKPPAA